MYHTHAYLYCHFSVFMGMVLGYGLCSLCGLFYSAAHTIIPFILLGIGIDNIFVITQTFNTLEASSVPAKLAQRLVLKLTFPH